MIRPDLPRSDRPRFSVVLPTRDRPHWLGAAAESVLEQTHSDFDLWIVDDGSDAPTTVVCDRLGTRDPRVRVLRNERSAGAAAARNQGILAGRGQYVAFIDDDCTWHPERLERIDAFLRARNPEPAYVATQTVLVSAGSPPRFTLDPVLPEGEPPWRVAPHMMVARRDLLLELGGFDDRLPRSHDWDLAIRLVDRAGWELLAQPLVWAQDLPGLTTDPSKLEKASRVLLKKYGRRSPVSRQLTVEFHRAFAHKILIRGHRWEGVKHYWMATRLSPLAMRNWATLLVALSGTSPYRFVTGVVARTRRSRGSDPSSGSSDVHLPP